jgi:hypothetical protein
MIGSSTLIVKKKDGSHRVHILGGVILGEISVKEMVKVDKKYRKKPDADNLSDKDVYKIVTSHQCNSEHQPHYSKFAGDRKWVLDLSNNSLIDIESFVNKYKDKYTNELETERQEFEKAAKKKIRQILKTYKEHSLILCKEMLAALEDCSTLKYEPVDYAKTSRGFDRIEFEIGDFSFGKSRRDNTVMFFAPKHSEDFTLTRDTFSFQKLLFDYLKKHGWKINTVNTVSTYDGTGSKYHISAFFAKKGQKTIYWNRHMEHDLFLVKIEQI